jgi:hypothetical protein
MKEAQQALRHLWQELYGNRQMDLLEGLFEEISQFKQQHQPPALPPEWYKDCLLYTSPSPRDRQKSRMPSSA